MAPNAKTILFVGTLLHLSIVLAQAKSAAREVNGIVEGAALLSVMVPQDRHAVDEVRWKYGSAAHARVLLGYSNGSIFKPYHGSYASYRQLLQRLNMHNKTTLRIRNLTNGDGGTYEADVQFKDGGTIIEEEFQLSVYYPVPEPHIEEKSRTHTSDGCNITLECQPSDAYNGHDLSITWFQGNLSERSHVTISTGSLLDVSLKSSADSRYFCFIRNPADTKNRSISLVCQGDSVRNPLVMMCVVIFITVIIVCFMFCGTYFSWKKKKRKAKASTKAELRETRSTDILYTDIMLVNTDRNEQAINYPENSIENCPREQFLEMKKAHKFQDMLVMEGERHALQRIRTVCSEADIPMGQLWKISDKPVH